MLWRGTNYLHCSSTVSNFCSFPSSAAVGIVTLVGCRARASLSGPWFLRTRSRVLFHHVEISCVSVSFFLVKMCNLLWLELHGVLEMTDKLSAFCQSVVKRAFLKTNCDGSMNGMCNTRHMLKWQLPGRCDQVASTTSGQCAHFMFNVPLSSNLHEMFSPHVSKMPLLCLHNSQSMRVKFPLWSKLMCYYS